MGKEILFLGLALTMASGIMYRFRLIQFDRFLQSNCPHLWIEYGMGDKRKHFLHRQKLLASLPLEYESDNAELNGKLSTLAWIHKSMVVGLTILLLGLLIGLYDALSA